MNSQNYTPKYGPIAKYRISEAHMPNFISLAIPDNAINARNLYLIALLINVKSSHTQHKQRLQSP